MTREVFGKIAKSQNCDSSMTTKGSDSTLPSVANDVEHEGFEYCNVVKKANMMGQTQLPKDLLGLFWNLVPRNGNTNAINGSGEGHHEGDQGASRQNGNGENNHGGGNGNGENNHGGGNGNGENNHGGGNGNGENNHGGRNDNNDDGDRGQCAIVDIAPRSGGYWVFPPDFVLPEDLKHAHIDPRFHFEFSRSKEGNKKILTRLSTRFDLNNAIPKHHEEKRFGWFQTHLNVFLENSDCLGAAKLQHDVRVVPKDEAVQTHTQRVNSQSNSGAWQFNGGLKVGVPVAKAKFGVSKSTKTKSSLTETVFEIPNAFEARNRTGSSPTAHLAYDFVFPKCPTDLNNIDDENRNWYLGSGLCSTVTPVIEGTWDRLNKAVDSPYTFRANRHVCELTSESPSTGNQCITRGSGMTKSNVPMTKRMQIKQVYELKLLVNHQMTHICNSRIELEEGGECDLMKVFQIEIAPPPTVTPPTVTESKGAEPPTGKKKRKRLWR
jgi:hypothetical protein